MKKILFFFLIICCLASNAQDKAYMEKQLRESKKEVYKLLEDFDQQITEAIKNKESQERIDELKKQRADLAKMLNLVDNVSALSKNKFDSNYVVKDKFPKFVSPVIPIPLKQPVIAPTKSQAKDSLLWYVGRRLNDSVLVTPERSVVLYSRVRNMVVVRPDERKDSTTINLVRALSQWKQWNAKYIATIAAEKNSFFEYPQIESDIDEFDWLEKQYSNIAKNTIDLPTQADLTVFVEPNSENPIGGPFAEYNDALRVLHQRLIDMMGDNPPLNVYEPTFDCYTCTTVLPEMDVQIWWARYFIEYELNLLLTMKMVKVYMAWHNISAAASGIPSLQQDLNAAVNKAFERWDNKMDILESLCKEEPNQMNTMLLSLLFLQQQKKLYTGVVDDSYAKRAKILLSGYRDIIEKRWDDYMSQKDYGQALNTCLISLFERHYTNLNRGITNFGAAMRKKIKAFNRFVLRIELKFEVEQYGLDRLMVNVTGEALTSEKIYVSLGRFHNKCNYQLYLTNTDYDGKDEHTFRIPLTALGGTKITHFENPPRIETRVYRGPPDLLMVFPYTSFNLINTPHLERDDRDRIDSVIFDIVRYVDEGLDRYSPGPGEYSVDFLAYLNKLFISGEIIKDDIGSFIETASNMTLQNVFSGPDRSTGYAGLDKMQFRFKMDGKQKYHQQMLTRVAHFPNTLVKVASRIADEMLVNRTKPLANSEFEDKYKLKSGSIKITVKHDPQ